MYVMLHLTTGNQSGNSLGAIFASMTGVLVAIIALIQRRMKSRNGK